MPDPRSRLGAPVAPAPHCDHPASCPRPLSRFLAAVRGHRWPVLPRLPLPGGCLVSDSSSFTRAEEPKAPFLLDQLTVDPFIAHHATMDFRPACGEGNRRVLGRTLRASSQGLLRLVGSLIVFVPLTLRPEARLVWKLLMFLIPCHFVSSAPRLLTPTHEVSRQSLSRNKALGPSPRALA